MRIALSIVFCAALGCGSGGGGSPAGPGSDMGASDLKKAGDMFLLSQCGHPGDKGNSLGVGKFCMTITDCQGNGMKTNICSSLGNGGEPSASDTYFCTIFPCKVDAGTGECGEGATCVCGSGGGMSGCACTPNSCLGGQ